MKKVGAIMFALTLLALLFFSTLPAHAQGNERFVMMKDTHTFGSLGYTPSSPHIFRALSTSSLTSAVSINAPVWWDNGRLNGSPVRVAVVDSGIRVSHEVLNTSPERFVSKSFVSNGNGSPNDFFGHGTHITGILAGFHNLFKGVAFGISRIINAKGLNDSGVGIDTDLMNALNWAALTENASVLSNSWGATGFPSGDSNISLFVDNLADKYNKILVFAAGNNGTNSDAYQINIPGDAYNVITVGAVNDNGTPNRSDDTIADFSSRGPVGPYYYYLNKSFHTSDDYLIDNITGEDNTTYPLYASRKKPDLVAPGVLINSSCKDSDTSYCVLNGTSMAVPHVSGAAALLMQYGLSPLEVKALLINSAEDKGNYGWDPEYGWGYLDLQKAYDLRDYVTNDSISNTSIAYVTNVTQGDKITLVWNRHVNLSAGLSTLNNLDLYLYDNHNRLRDYSTSFYDNVEQVVANFDGEAIIKVDPVSVNGSENYSISFSKPVTYYKPKPEINIMGQSILKQGRKAKFYVYILDMYGVKNYNISLIKGNETFPVEVTPVAQLPSSYNLYVTSKDQLDKGYYTLVVNASSICANSEVGESSFGFVVSNYTDGLSNVSFSYPGNTLDKNDNLTVSFNLINSTSSQGNWYILNSNFNSLIGFLNVSNGTNSFTIDSSTFTTSGYHLFVLYFNNIINGSPYVALLNVAESESTGSGNNNPIIPITGGGSSAPSSPPSGGGSIINLIRNRTSEIMENLSNINESLGLLNNIGVGMENTSQMLENLTNLLAQANMTGNLTLINEIKAQIGNLSQSIPEVEVVANESLVQVFNKSLAQNDTLINLPVSASMVVYNVTDKLTNNSYPITQVREVITNSLDKPLENVSIIMEIPKSYATTTQEIEFHGNGTMIILKDDPVVKWVFDKIMPNETRTISYEIKKDLSIVEEAPAVVITKESKKTVIKQHPGEENHTFVATGTTGTQINHSSSILNNIFKSRGEFYSFVALTTFLLLIVFFSLKNIKRV